MRKFADDRVAPFAQQWHLKNDYIPLDIIAQMSELGVFSLTIPEDYDGMGLGKEIDVRRLRGIVARLYRRRLARHPFGDRRRIHPRLRHRGTKAQMAAENRLRRSAADGGVHRAEYRLRSRLAEDARGAPGRRLQGLRQQDLDHASGARRPDDASGAHQPAETGYRGLSMLLAEKPRGTTTIRSRPRHDRHRDRGARLSRHEGIRDRASTVSPSRRRTCSAASRGSASSS